LKEERDIAVPLKFKTRNPHFGPMHKASSALYTYDKPFLFTS